MPSPDVTLERKVERHDASVFALIREAEFWRSNGASWSQYDWEQHRAQLLALARRYTRALDSLRRPSRAKT